VEEEEALLEKIDTCNELSSGEREGRKGEEIITLSHRIFSKQDIVVEVVCLEDIPSHISNQFYQQFVLSLVDKCCHTVS
jgi:hypothetical protein